jgi:hypothetical protein
MMKTQFISTKAQRPIAWTGVCLALTGLLAACGGSGDTLTPNSERSTIAMAQSSWAGDVPQAAIAQQSRVSAAAAGTPTGASGSISVFSNGAYGGGVSNWSWNLCNANPTAQLGGLTVLFFNECQGGNWGSGGYLHLGTPVVDATSIQFDIYLGTNPGATTQQISLAFGSGTKGVALSSLLPAPTANAWNSVKLDLKTVMNGVAFQDFMLMNATGHPKFYINNVVLSNGSATSGGTGGANVSIMIDAKASVHEISPLIYGVAAFDNVGSVLSALNSPINRHGGNATSAYNWKTNASGRGQDWYFESVGDDSNGTAAGAVSNLVQANRTAGAQSMITVPMLPWVARLGPNRSKLSSFSVTKYGAQQQTDAQWMPDAGNGVRTNGSLITGNDPADAHTPRQ